MVQAHLPGEQVLVFFRYLTFVVVMLVYIQGEGLPPTVLIAFSAAAGLFVLTTAFLKWQYEVGGRCLEACLWFELAVATAVNGTASFFSPLGLTALLHVPVAATFLMAVERGRWRRFMAALVGAWLLSSLPAWLVLPGFSGLFRAGLFGSFLGLMAGAGVLVRNLIEERQRSATLLAEVNSSRDSLQAAYRQLEESVTQKEELAMLQERARVARDLHDSVAHTHTVLMLQMQIARRLLVPAPAEAATAIARAEELARTALHEIRSAVRGLYKPNLQDGTLVAVLQRLGDQFAAGTGVRVDVSAGSGVESLAVGHQQLRHLFHIFQEVLTNAYRHAAAQQVRATLALQDGQLAITLENDGRPPSSLAPGFGMRSIMDRAKALGGSVTFVAREQGLCVYLTLPVAEEVRP